MISAVIMTKLLVFIFFPSKSGCIELNTVNQIKLTIINLYYNYINLNCLLLNCTVKSINWIWQTMFLVFPSCVKEAHAEATRTYF